MISLIALTLTRSIQLHVAFLLTTWNCTLPTRQPRIAHHCPTPLRTSKAGPINGNWLINPEKSLLMQFGSSKHDRPMYFICDKLIAPSDFIRDLGITYDSKLCFHDYINEIVGRAYQRVNLLFRSFVSQNVSILTGAFLTYVRPILEYCTPIWSPHQSYLIDKIEHVRTIFHQKGFISNQTVIHGKTPDIEPRTVGG